MSSFVDVKGKQLANICIKELNIIDEKKIEETQYGAYFLVSALVKLPFMYLPSIILGILPQVLLSSVIFSVFRYFAGGVHARTHQGCMFAGNFIMGYGPLAISYGLAKLNINNTLAFNIDTIMITIATLIILKYAPADLKNKPVISKERRLQLRSGALLFIIIAYVISELLLNRIYAGIVISAILLESLSITPLAYKIFKNAYGAGSGINNR